MLKNSPVIFSEEISNMVQIFKKNNGQELILLQPKFFPKT